MLEEEAETGFANPSTQIGNATRATGLVLTFVPELLSITIFQKL